MPRVAVTGGRATEFKALDETWFLGLLNLLAERGPIELVVGDAKGIDKSVRDLARKHALPLRVFNADWASYGKRAGPLRNERLIDYTRARQNSLLVAFPGGAGTAHCVSYARKCGLQVVLARGYLNQDSDPAKLNTGPGVASAQAIEKGTSDSIESAHAVCTRSTRLPEAAGVPDRVAPCQGTNAARTSATLVRRAGAGVPGK